MTAPVDRPERVDGNYEGFFSVIVCAACDFDHHVEGDVSSGDEIECEGCKRLMVVTGR